MTNIKDYIKELLPTISIVLLLPLLFWLFTGDWKFVIYIYISFFSLIIIILFLLFINKTKLDMKYISVMVKKPKKRNETTRNN